MRHERVDQLIEAIKNGLPEVNFDMRGWVNPQFDGSCNACIAGHAAILAVGLDAAKEANRYGMIADTAIEWLGIGEGTSAGLFLPPEPHACTDRKWAVKQLKRLKELA